MAPGGSPEDGGTMAEQFAHGTTALTRMKFRTLKNIIR